MSSIKVSKIKLGGIFFIFAFAMTFQGCVLNQPNNIYMGAYSINLECYDASDLNVKVGRKTFSIYSNVNNFGERIIAPLKTNDSNNLHFPPDSTIYPALLTSVDISWYSYHPYRDRLYYTLKFEEIFKNNAIPYEQKPEDIYWKIPMSSFVPIVTIEVIDKTLNVYLDAQINVNDSNETKGFKATRFKKLMFTTTLER